MKNPFDLEEQFAAYLKRVGLNPETMSPVQLTETKRAFYGCAGQLLIATRDNFVNMTDEQCGEALDNMLNQVGEFWLKQKNRLN